jgi:vacuolar protein sorting-associated protein 54
MIDLTTRILEETAFTIKDLGRNTISSVIQLEQINSPISCQTLPKAKPPSKQYIKIIDTYKNPSKKQVTLGDLDRELGDLVDILDEISEQKTLPLKVELKNDLIPLFTNINFNLKDPNHFESVLSLVDEKGSGHRGSMTADSIVSTTASSVAVSIRRETKDFTRLEFKTLLSVLSKLYKSTTTQVQDFILNEKQSIFKNSLEKSTLIKAEIERLITVVEHIKFSLQTIQEFNVNQGMMVLDMKQQRSECIILFKIVKTLNRLFILEKRFEELIEIHDYIGVLDAFEEAFLIYNRELISVDPDHFNAGNMFSSENAKQIALGVKIMNPQFVGFQGIECIKQQCKRFHIITKTVMEQMSTRFNEILQSDISSFLQKLESLPKERHRQSSETNLQATIRKISIGDQVLPLPFQNSISLGQYDILISPKDKIVKDNLRPYVFGMIKMDKFHIALEELKGFCYIQLDQMLQSCLEKIAPSTSKSKEDNALDIKMLPFDTYFKFLCNSYVNTLEFIGQYAIYNQIFIELILEAQERQMKLSSFDIDLLQVWSTTEDSKLKKTNVFTKMQKSIISKTFDELINESRNYLSFIIDYSQLVCSKLLQSRSKQNVKLNLKDFYRIFTTTHNYQSMGEQISGKLLFNIKGVLLNLGKSWIVNFHEDKLKQMSGLLDNEQWIQTEIPIDFQKLVERLKSDLQRLESLKEIKKDIGIDVDAEDLDHTDNEIDGEIKADSTDSNPNQSNRKEETVTKYLVYEGVKYHTVTSVLIFIKTLSDYIDIAKNVSILTPEILNKVFELLKV